MKNVYKTIMLSLGLCSTPALLPNVEEGNVQEQGRLAAFGQNVEDEARAIARAIDEKAKEAYEKAKALGQEAGEKLEQAGSSAKEAFYKAEDQAADQQDPILP